MPKTYDPNWRNGVHTLKITLQVWDYKGHLWIKIGGNCKGYQLIDGLPDTLMEPNDMESDCSFRVDDDGEWWSALLQNDQGDELEYEGDWRELEQSIVAVEIVDFIPEEKRK